MSCPPGSVLDSFYIADEAADAHFGTDGKLYRECYKLYTALTVKYRHLATFRDGKFTQSRYSQLYKEDIETKNAPAAIGPYVQGIALENLVFTSGQLPLDPESNKMPESVYDQTIQSLKNIEAILLEAGSDLTKVVRCGVFLKDMNDFADMNKAYATFFPERKPCRSAIEVARLPKDALVEIEAIAYR